MRKYKFICAVFLSGILIADPLLAGLADSHIWSDRRSATLPSDNPIVIHVRDIHGNLVSQRDISNFIQKLVDAQQVDLLALEGATGPVSLRGFQTFSEKENVRAVADYLLTDGTMGGPIHAALTASSNFPAIVGVDDPLHYPANIESYRAALKVQDRNRLEMESLRKHISPMDADLRLIEKLLSFSLTRQEWGHVSRLSAGHFFRFKNLDLSPAMDFYRHAQFRDVSMAQNLISEIKKRNAKVTVLVAGGFHSEGIVAEIRKANMNVHLWTPRYAPAKKPSNYLSVFEQENISMFLVDNPLRPLFRAACGVAAMESASTDIAGTLKQILPEALFDSAYRIDHLSPGMERHSEVVIKRGRSHGRLLLNWLPSVSGIRAHVVKLTVLAVEKVDLALDMAFDLPRLRIGNPVPVGDTLNVYPERSLFPNVSTARGVDIPFWTSVHVAHMVRNKKLQMRQPNEPAHAHGKRLLRIYLNDIAQFARRVEANDPVFDDLENFAFKTHLNDPALIPGFYDAITNRGFVLEPMPNRLVRFLDWLGTWLLLMEIGRRKSRIGVTRVMWVQRSEMGKLAEIFESLRADADLRLAAALKKTAVPEVTASIPATEFLYTFRWIKWFSRHPVEQRFQNRFWQAAFVGLLWTVRAFGVAMIYGAMLAPPVIGINRGHYFLSGYWLLTVAASAFIAFQGPDRKLTLIHKLLLAPAYYPNEMVHRLYNLVFPWARLTMDRKLDKTPRPLDEWQRGDIVRLKGEIGKVKSNLIKNEERTLVISFSPFEQEEIRGEDLGALIQKKGLIYLGRPQKVSSKRISLIAAMFPPISLGLEDFFKYLEEKNIPKNDVTLNILRTFIDQYTKNMSVTLKADLLDYEKTLPATVTLPPALDEAEQQADEPAEDNAKQPVLAFRRFEASYREAKSHDEPATAFINWAKTKPVYWVTLSDSGEMPGDWVEDWGAVRRKFDLRNSTLRLHLRRDHKEVLLDVVRSGHESPFVRLTLNSNWRFDFLEFLDNKVEPEEPSVPPMIQPDPVYEPPVEMPVQAQDVPEEPEELSVPPMIQPDPLPEPPMEIIVPVQVPNKIVSPPAVLLRRRPKIIVLKNNFSKRDPDFIPEPSWDLFFDSKTNRLRPSPDLTPLIESMDRTNRIRLERNELQKLVPELLIRVLLFVAMDNPKDRDAMMKLRENISLTELKATLSRLTDFSVRWAKIFVGPTHFYPDVLMNNFVTKGKVEGQTAWSRLFRNFGFPVLASDQQEEKEKVVFPSSPGDYYDSDRKTLLPEPPLMQEFERKVTKGEFGTTLAVIDWDQFAPLIPWFVVRMVVTALHQDIPSHAQLMQRRNNLSFDAFEASLTMLKDFTNQKEVWIAPFKKKKFQHSIARVLGERVTNSPLSAWWSALHEIGLLVADPTSEFEMVSPSKAYAVFGMKLTKQSPPKVVLIKHGKKGAQTLTGPEGRCRSFVFSPDEKELAAIERTEATGTFHVWRWSLGSNGETIAGKQVGEYSDFPKIEFGPHKQMIINGLPDVSVKKYSPPNPRSLKASA